MSEEELIVVRLTKAQWLAVREGLKQAVYRADGVKGEPQPVFYIPKTEQAIALVNLWRRIGRQIEYPRLIEEEEEEVK